MDDLNLYAKNDDLEGLLSTLKRFNKDMGIQSHLKKCVKVTSKSLKTSL